MPHLSTVRKKSRRGEHILGSPFFIYWATSNEPDSKGPGHSSKRRDSRCLPLLHDQSVVENLKEERMQPSSMQAGASRNDPLEVNFKQLDDGGLAVSG